MKKNSGRTKMIKNETTPPPLPDNISQLVAQIQTLVDTAALNNSQSDDLASSSSSSLTSYNGSNVDDNAIIRSLLGGNSADEDEVETRRKERETLYSRCYYTTDEYIDKDIDTI